MNDDAITPGAPDSGSGSGDAASGSGDGRRGDRASRWRRRRPRTAAGGDAGGSERPEAAAPADAGGDDPGEPRAPRERSDRPRGPRPRGRGSREGGREGARDGAERPREAGRDGGRRDGRPNPARDAGRNDRARDGDRGARLPVNQKSSGERPTGGPRRRPPEGDAGRRPRVPEAIRADRGRPAPVQPPELKVMIAGGGTGGHIYPALAVAEEIRRRNRGSKILFVGTPKGLEARLVPEAGFKIEHLNLSGYQGRGFFARIQALVQFVQGTMKARALIRSWQPELVLGTGGYVSGPAVLAARLLGVRTIIQEQNSVPGRMNRILSRWVDEVHVAFTEARSQFKQTDKVRLSGNPVLCRQQRGSLLTLLERYGLDPTRKTVLIFGGSRGAHSLNLAVADMLGRFSGRDDVQFIIQTGPEDHAAVEQKARQSGVKAIVKPYLSPMGEAYAMANLVVCRAGAMTLAEITQFALPAILVPYPHAIYQHQLKNARILFEKGAAELLLDGDLSAETLAGRIDALLADEARRRELGRNAWRLARPDAHERVVNAIENLTHPVARRQPLDMDLEEAEAAAARPSGA